MSSRTPLFFTSTLLSLALLTSLSGCLQTAQTPQPSPTSVPGPVSHHTAPPPRRTVPSRFRI